MKSSLSYQAHHLFARAAYNAEMLTKIMLAIMMNCLFGGPVFVAKMIPGFKLNADFEYEIVNSVLDSIIAAEENVVTTLISHFQEI